MRTRKRDQIRSLRELPSPLVEDPRPIEKLTIEDLDTDSDWLRVVAASTTLGILVHDRDRILWINRAVERMTGYTRDELLELSPLDLVAPDARAQLDERWEERLRRRDTTPHRYEVCVRRKDGAERWVELSLSTIEFRGKLAGLGTVFDVTERKEADQALRASEERLQLAQQAGDIIVWDWDIESDRLYYSAHAKNLLDLGPRGVEHDQGVPHPRPPSGPATPRERARGRARGRSRLLRRTPIGAVDRPDPLARGAGQGGSRRHR